MVDTLNHSMNFRRIVFIDFDGVTHRANGPAGETLPFDWLPHLAQLVSQHPSVGVVVHSSWREQFEEEYLRDFLEPLAHQFAGAVGPGAKGAAITEYLRAHPEIDDSIVLDDQPVDVGGIAGVAILRCDPRLGISCPDAQSHLKVWLDRTHERESATSAGSR